MSQATKTMTGAGPGQLIARIGISFVTGIVVTFALIWFMQFLITTGKDALTDQSEWRIPDFIRVRQEETIQQKDRKPPRPPEVEEKPPEAPPPDLEMMDPNTPTVNLGYVDVGINVGLGGTDFTVDGEYLPIGRVEPLYPRRAQSRGLEGYCDMDFTVTKTGEVMDAVAIECSNSVFKSASVKAVLRWKYKPRVVDGEPIDSPGVQTRLTYKFEED
jgi:protein TonB